MGTPTMGGIMIIIPVAMVSDPAFNAVSLLGLNVLGAFNPHYPLLVMIAFAILGAIDDWEGIRGPRRGLGMRARTKFLLQIILADNATAFILKNYHQCSADVLAWLTS